MLILFLVCILATLVTVHRATCYRQFQVPPGHHLISPSNCPRRRDVTRLCATSSQLPKTALRPILTPGFLKENMSHCNSKYLGRSYNVFVLNCNTRADDTVDGVPEVVCSGGSLPKRVRTNNMLDQKRLSSFLPKPNEQTLSLFCKGERDPPAILRRSSLSEFRPSPWSPGLFNIFASPKFPPPPYFPAHEYFLFPVLSFLDFSVLHCRLLSLSSPPQELLTVLHY